MRVSQFYKLGRSQATLDFVDVDTVVDLYHYQLQTTSDSFSYPKPSSELTFNTIRASIFDTFY